MCKNTYKNDTKIYAIYFIIMFDFRKQKLLLRAHKLYLPFHLLDIATYLSKKRWDCQRKRKDRWQDLIYFFHYQVFYEVENFTEMSCIQWLQSVLILNQSTKKQCMPGVVLHKLLHIINWIEKQFKRVHFVFFFY